MINKVYEKIKKYIQENWKYLLVLIIGTIVLLYPLPYYIYSGGGTIPIEDRVQVEGSSKKEGQFSFAYVKELKGTVASFLLAKIMPSWDIEEQDDYKLSEDESEQDISFRNYIYLENANQTAIMLAYQKADKEIEIIDEHYYVLYVENKDTTTLQVGDELVKIEGKELTSVSDYTSLVAQKEIGDTIHLTVLRNNEEKEVVAQVNDYDGEKLTGISITTIYEYETDPNLTLSFKSSEGGPSGGLMLTLEIYNQLIDEDITKGKNIVGTGTIDSEGNVGSIGGVKYKLKGAVDSGADLFLVPAGENYEEAKKEKEEHHYDIQIEAVSTFDEALEVLASL